MGRLLQSKETSGMNQQHCQIGKLPAILLTGLVLSGCTTQAWYEGNRESQRQHCREMYKSADDQQKCIDEINGKTFQKYQDEKGATK